METALVVGVVLVMVLGAVQIGMVGYLQMTADAASFINAHQNVIGVSSGTPASATASIFPEIKSSDITTAVLPAPVPTVYVDYGYNDPDPTVAASSISNRHGGAAIMQPSQMQSTVAKSSVTSILGVPIGVSGSMIEPQWMENGAHFDVSNLNYGSTDPSFQVNYFQNGENVPPYYVGFNYLMHCTDNQPWTSGSCSSAGQDFLAMGVAEHLDLSNWTVPIMQGGSAISGTWGGTATAASTASAFTQLACHQRQFAAVAQFLANYSDLPTLRATYPMKPLTHSTRADGSLMPIFQGFTGFDSPTNTAIQTIYGWDREITAGYPDPRTYTGPGSAPVYPWQGSSC
ncbi:MAG TPA: hypothetical protein VKG44_01695 [Candidatus Baltobacteraceae bacterium]|nr:hypothetical protein [Candidatus Baltobacteraceae bacterium]